MRNTLIFTVIFYNIIKDINCVTLIQDDNKKFVTIKPEEINRVTLKKYKPYIKPKLVSRVNKSETTMNSKSYEVFEDLSEDVPIPYSLQLRNQYSSINNDTEHQQFIKPKISDEDKVFETAESRNIPVQNDYEVTERPENEIEDPYSQENYNNKKSQFVLIPKPQLYTTAVLKPYAEKYVRPIFILHPVYSINRDYKYKPIRVKVLKPYIIPVETSNNNYQKPILIKVLKPQNDKNYEYETKQQDSREYDPNEIQDDIYGEDTKDPPKSYQIYKNYEPKTIFKYTVDTLHKTDNYENEKKDKYIHYYNEKPKPWNGYAQRNKH